MARRARALLIDASRWAAAAGAIALAATACRAVTGVDDYQTGEPACSGDDCSSGGGEAPSSTGKGGSDGASTGHGGGPDAVGSGSTSAAQTTVSSSTGCTPRGCGGEPPACGTIEDGCGSSVICADCTAPAACVNGSCCVLLTCATVGCLYVGTDGCGGTLDCTCTPPAICDPDPDSNTCACVPESCESLGIECGQAEDGCGTPIFCGGCGPGCGGGCLGGICECGQQRPEPR